MGARRSCDLCARFLLGACLLSLSCVDLGALRASTLSRRLLPRKMALLLLSAAASSFSPASIPSKSTTQGAPNLSWKWRGFNVRYQQAGCDTNKDGPAVVLVHGLFVNADHWRRNLPALADAGCRVYAIDLLGYGYSDKPHPTSAEAKAISGENGRSLGAPEVELGTGRVDGAPQAVEAHPLGGVYNFYTWAEQINDFMEEVKADSVTLVASSIGSISLCRRPSTSRHG